MVYFKIQGVGNFLQCVVKDDLSLFQDQNGIDQIDHVPDLMRGDNYNALIEHGLCDQLAKLRFGGNVQAIGGFIQNDDACVGGKRKTEHHLFLLSEGELFKL